MSPHALAAPMSGVTPKTSVPTSKTRRNVLVALVVIIVVGGLGSAYALGAFNQSQKPSWLFQGAYVTYQGKTQVLLSTINVTVRFQILSFNSSKVQILEYYSVGGSTNQTTTWYPYSQKGPYNLGQTCMTSTTTTRLVNGMTYNGLIAEKCTADTTTTTDYYASENAPFAVERVITFDSLSVDLVVTSTNISGIT